MLFRSFIRPRYASRVKLITNDASKNAESKEVARLKGVSTLSNVCSEAQVTSKLFQATNDHLFVDLMLEMLSLNYNYVSD